MSDFRLMPLFRRAQRGLCCFPALTPKKMNLALLSEKSSMLSTNSSDTFLQVKHGTLSPKCWLKSHSKPRRNWHIWINESESDPK